MIIGDCDFFHLASLQQGLKVTVGKQLLMRTAEKTLDSQQRQGYADEIPKGKMLFGIHVRTVPRARRRFLAVSLTETRDEIVVQRTEDQSDIPAPTEAFDESQQEAAPAQ